MSPTALIRRRFVLPPPALRPFVERIWSWESDGPVPLPLLLPGTGADLLLHYRTPFLALGSDGSQQVVAPAQISCLRSFSCRLLAQGPVGFLAVRFRASVIRHFGRLKMADLIDRFAAAAEHFGPEIDELPARLAALPDLTTRAACAAQFLLESCERTAPAFVPADYAIDALYYAEPGMTIDVLAEDLGYGRRQLERIVGASAGLSPKRFQRVARLHHTVRELLLKQSTGYLDTALAHGYYDQAHFIHEMGALTGRRPGQVFTPESFVSHFYNPRLPR